MTDKTKKPWQDERELRAVLSLPEINSDEDAADYFERQGFSVGRRRIGEARNLFEIAPLSKQEVVEVEVEELESPNILFLDIETRPNLGYFWRMWDENIGLSQMTEEGEMISFAAKWRGREEVVFYSNFHDGHEKMTQAARDLLDQADFVAHWNGKKFDIPHMNKEFVLQGLTPPSAYKQLDLMLTARKQFKFVSNKLQHISTALGFDGKFSHEGFELWKKCMADDPEAWSVMKEYNIQDVVLLEQIYDRILPWIKGHPNVPLYTGVGSCTQCGSDNVIKEGKAYMSTRTYDKFRCLDCGAQMRGKKFKDAAELIPLSY